MIRTAATCGCRDAQDRRCGLPLYATSLDACRGALVCARCDHAHEMPRVR